jgi:hypothetical protein
MCETGTGQQVAQLHDRYMMMMIIIVLLPNFSLLNFSWKHSPTLGYVINRNRPHGLIYNLKSSLQLNMFQELQIFAFAVCTVRIGM